MSKRLRINLIYILLLVFIFCFFMFFFFMKQGLLSVDTGREYYLAQQVAHGEILYKTIFNIHGPFSYQFNGLLFKIFGEKLMTLYLAGIINSLIIIITCFLIARKFFTHNIAILICLSIMFVMVFPTFLFNSNITYSYGIIYALSSFLLSLLFLLEYVKNGKNKFAYLSCFFAGLSILNKYEFVFYILVLIFALWKIKPIDLKGAMNSLLCFCIMPVISFSVLFLQGLTITDLKNAFDFMIKTAQSPSMQLFYSRYGIIFKSSQYLSLIKENLLITFLGFLPILNIVGIGVYWKEIKKNRTLLVFGLASILAAFKFTMFIDIEHMGIFVFPLCLTFFLIIMKKSWHKNKFLILFLAILILNFSIKDFFSLSQRTYKLQTEKGNMYLLPKDGKTIDEVSSFILNNTKKTDKISIYPEGAIINFITDRKTDNIYHNLVPMYYLDVFGEGNILEYYNNAKNDYFVILPLSTLEYGYEKFCDYAIGFCEMINNNYDLVYSENEIKIYKKKEQE